MDLLGFSKLCTDAELQCCVGLIGNETQAACQSNGQSCMLALVDLIAVSEWMIGTHFAVDMRSFMT
jgi:hypothetical protein